MGKERGTLLPKAGHRRRDLGKGGDCGVGKYEGRVKLALLECLFNQRKKRR